MLKMTPICFNHQTLKDKLKKEIIYSVLEYNNHVRIIEVAD